MLKVDMETNPRLRITFKLITTIRLEPTNSRYFRSERKSVNINRWYVVSKTKTSFISSKMLATFEMNGLV